MAETLAAPPTPATTSPAGDGEALSAEDAADRAEQLKTSKAAKPAEPKDADEDEEDDDFQLQADGMFYGKEPDTKAEEPKEKKSEEKKPEKKTEAKGEESDETSKPKVKEEVDSPPPPDLVDVEFRGSKVRISKEHSNALQEAEERAQALERGLKEQVRLLSEKPMETLFDHLTHTTGSREEAYKKLLDEAAQVVRAEVEYQQMPPEQRRLREMETRSQKIERELAEYKKREEAEKQQAARAKATESLMVEVVGAFKKIGLPQERELAFETAQTLEFLRGQGKKANAHEVMKYLASERTRKEKERETQTEERLLRQLPIEEFAKRYPERVSQLREWDVARLESEKRSQPKKPEKAEAKEDKPPSKPRLLNAVEYSKYFTGR
jgi:hypothetical protein